MNWQPGSQKQTANSKTLSLFFSGVFCFQFQTWHRSTTKKLSCSQSETNVVQIEDCANWNNTSKTLKEKTSLSKGPTQRENFVPRQPLCASNHTQLRSKEDWKSLETENQDAGSDEDTNSQDDFSLDVNKPSHQSSPVLDLAASVGQQQITSYHMCKENACKNISVSKIDAMIVLQWRWLVRKDGTETSTKQSDVSQSAHPIVLQMSENKFYYLFIFIFLQKSIWQGRNVDVAFCHGIPSNGTPALTWKHSAFWSLSRNFLGVWGLLAAGPAPCGHPVSCRQKFRPHTKFLIWQI